MHRALIDCIMEKTLVVGGSGFVGSALQLEVLKNNTEKNFAFSYHAKPEKIDGKLETLRLDLLNPEKASEITEFSRAVYVAGNADHGLAKRDPLLDLDLNVRAFLNFMREFRGSLVLLSSQAVYYGLEGEIPENVDHLATMPYGLSKQMMESYARFFQKEGKLSKLWIFRMMYAFGEREKDYRLIPKCAKAVREKGKVTLFGGGKSFVNPLPVDFVASTLMKASSSLEEKPKATLETTNLNHPTKTAVKDVVQYLHSLEPFDFEVEESGEEWPVKFYGDTANLAGHLKEWHTQFPSLQDSLKKYFTNLVRGKTL
jgi:nucleoside-diphosphate-sugar epimerase